MILIDSVFIHTGGGKSLLDYLISELKKTNVQVFYLLDQRYKPHMTMEASDNVKFVNGFFSRCKFYSKNRNKFTKVFCLGNIPPHIPMKNAYTIIYLHSASYLHPIIETTLIGKISKYFKKKIFYALLNNSDLWMVQTENMKELFQKKTSILTDNIKILPFFQNIEQRFGVINKEENSFFYPGSAEPHKNHKRIIEAFCTFYDKYKIGSFYITVTEEFKEIFDFIEIKKSQSYPIFNLGYISDKQDIAKVYFKSEYLIFPSLQESFGLPLIEAIEFDCKIIAANLEYVDQVCVPSYTFDPYSVISMSEAFKNVIDNKDLPKSYAKVHNEINHIISYIIR